MTRYRYHKRDPLATAGRVELDGLVDAHFPLEEVDQALRAGRENPTLLKVVVGVNRNNF